MTPSSPLGPQPLFDAHIPSAVALRAIEAHPRFSVAQRMLATSAVALTRGNRILSMIVTDRARYLIGIFAIHLHHQSRPGDPRSGLTLSRIIAICAEQKICSAGRVKAVLVLMRMFGYLASARSKEDRRLHRLVPTDALLALHRENFTFTLEAVAKLVPEGAEALAALRSPDFLSCLLSHYAGLHLEGFYYVDHVPEARMFFERNAGAVMLFSIWLASQVADGVPSRDSVPILPAPLGRQFGVSRSHVRLMVQEAISAGLLASDQTQPNHYHLTPALHAAFARFSALYILHTLHAARAAFAEIAQRRGVA
jgi:hypothetical protein